MKEAKEFWKEKFGEYPQNDSEKLAVVMMAEYAREAVSEALRKHEVIKSACCCESCKTSELITDGCCNVCGAMQAVL